MSDPGLAIRIADGWSWSLTRRSSRPWRQGPVRSASQGSVAGGVRGLARLCSTGEVTSKPRPVVESGQLWGVGRGGGGGRGGPSIHRGQFRADSWVS